MKVSIITASVLERAEMLAEAVASTERQTYPHVEHYVSIDADRIGAGPHLNDMLARVTTEWVMVLDDDDLLDANHVETLMANSEGFDVIYSMPRIDPPEIDFPNYTRPFSAGRLVNMNCVAPTALVRTEMVREVGGWKNIRPYDWDMWQRLEAHGAEFNQLLEHTTWTYRLHGDNWSRGGLATDDDLEAWGQQ